MDLPIGKSKNFIICENVKPTKVDAGQQTHKKRQAKTSLPSKKYKIRTNYDTMFSDTRPRNQIKMKSPKRKTSLIHLVRTKPKEVENLKKIMEVQGSHRTLFYRQPSRRHISSYSTVVVNLEADKPNLKKVTFGSDSEPSTVEIIKQKPAVVITLPAKSSKSVTKSTQTDYRESETQTLPWKHEIKAEENFLAELVAVENLDLEMNFPPGIEDVTLIEKARQKLAWENVIARLRGKENESTRRRLVLKVAADEIAFRERQIDEMNSQRIDLSRENMIEERKKWENQLLSRLERFLRTKKAENNSKITYMKHQLRRKLRKISLNRNQTSVKSKKSNIIEFYEDKTSELYAPKLREGEDPSRGHEIIDIQCRYLKRYHGLRTLEKNITNAFQPKVVGFNYEAASKPKKVELCQKHYNEKSIHSHEKYTKKKFLPPLKVKIPLQSPTSASTKTTTPKRVLQRTDSEENIYRICVLLGKIIQMEAKVSSQSADFMSE